ncbi:peptidase M20, partial [bacterium]|nr:peptidase M20 [bacterium]
MTFLPIRRAMCTLALAALAPAVVGAQAKPSTTPVFTPGKLSPTQEVARGVLKELVEINTSVSTGNITNGALAMAKRFRAAGIPDSDIF